jgi:intracellular sulfur oxidation DsrE/DsrF family protein
MRALAYRHLLALLLIAAASSAWAEARIVNPPYKAPKAVFEFYLDDPAKLGSALFWVRSYMNPLIAEPYNLAPEFMDTVIVMHGTEIVALAKHNYERYREAVERLRYYAQLGVRVRLCALAAADYGYQPADLYDFVELAPSAMADLVYWQQQGYGLVIPQVLEKRFSIDEIR